MSILASTSQFLHGNRLSPCPSPPNTKATGALIGAVFNEILARRDDLARILQEPFYFDARGQQAPGRPPYPLVPIFNFHAGYLNVLYKREDSDLALRLPQVPALSEQQIEALDLLDEGCDELALEFEVRPGEILIVNNYDLLHARSAYRDQGPGAQKRHMLRLYAACHKLPSSQ